MGNALNIFSLQSIIITVLLIASISSDVPGKKDTQVESYGNIIQTNDLSEQVFSGETRDNRPESSIFLAAKPTRTPRPTPTPPYIPPQSDPEYIGLMILLGIFSIGVILLGVWINRKQLNR
jgi:hypothetical protein